jgi:hypothetical protein
MDFIGMNWPRSTTRVIWRGATLLIHRSHRSSAPEEAAEEVESVTSAAEADNGNRGLIAALKRCATQNQTFSAASEGVP